MLRVLFVGILGLLGFVSAPARAEPPQRAEGQGAEGGATFHADIAALTRQNTAFRRVLFTAKKMQIVAMSIPPGGDIGEEMHQRVEQVLFLVEGEGKVVINGVASPFRPGDVVLVTPGVRHNFVNTGKAPLKLYTLYAPPNHLPGRVHLTKADAEADVENEAFGRLVE
ncbi:cupin domain-containing protein [Polyangium spumosum]|uniref:Cupin domain-containing protein n=1 Tax=Polyangium spumosum TaxID=889282 RepID=A0A6N7Q3B1_9BACT|nr:cupin domain-containing protein [Polyangium spumosum]MRG96784.1 cupin domain-containing protein [Polyangium spumosum]